LTSAREEREDRHPSRLGRGSREWIAGVIANRKATEHVDANHVRSIRLE
jgi:hypothetical protein